jgi:competence protein ComFB
MEDAVRKSLEEILAETAYLDFKPTEKEKMDVMALTLNRIPPRYVVSEKGYLFTRAEELRQQFKTDLLVELTRAIDQVRKNPRS